MRMRATGAMLWVVVVGICGGIEGQEIRLGYVIPTDRAPQANAIANLQQYLPTVASWYREQMDRYGFGPKTFEYETEADGVTPRVHVVNTFLTAAAIRSNTWDNTITAASNGGLSIWSNNQVWMLFPESHLQQPSGAISGGTALGAGFGSGNSGGVAMGGSDFLFRLAPAQLTNNAGYAGSFVPSIGPHPLVQDTSFPWFEGSTFSSIASSAQGAMAHELGHAFGLPHDSRNDANFHGNLMGNGLRGWRGSFAPDDFPADDVQLSYGAALALSVNRYFNADQPYTDTQVPSLAVDQSGATPLVDGKLQVSFSASDASGLAVAWLQRNGDLIAEMPLSGTSVDATFATPYFVAGQNDQFTVSVFDTQGNRQNTSVTITPQSGGGNLAPQPFLRISQSTLGLGQWVELNAGQSFDPNDSPTSLLYEWDLDGNGVFTPPSSTSLLAVQFDTPGARLISVRVTDPLGAWAISAPLAIRVVPEPATWILALGAAPAAAFRALVRRRRQAIRRL